MWAEATRGMQSAAAQHGKRRAGAGRRAAQARKAWQLLRARLQGDVSSSAAAHGTTCRATLRAGSRQRKKHASAARTPAAFRLFS